MSEVDTTIWLWLQRMSGVDDKYLSVLGETLPEMVDPDELTRVNELGRGMCASFFNIGKGKLINVYYKGRVLYSNKNGREWHRRKVINE